VRNRESGKKRIAEKYSKLYVKGKKVPIGKSSRPKYGLYKKDHQEQKNSGRGR